MNDIIELTYWIASIGIRSLSIAYEVSNRVEGQDFRRIMFLKRLELFAVLGDDYKKMAEKGILELLCDYPYND